MRPDYFSDNIISRVIIEQVLPRPRMVHRSSGISNLVNPVCLSGKILTGITIILLFLTGFVTAETNESLVENQVNIDLLVSPPDVEVGDIISVEGYIDPALLLNPNDKILLQVTSPHESGADAYYQLNVNKSGIFRVEIPADSMGDWAFNARYNDYKSGNVPVKVSARTRAKETYITLNGPYSRPFSGDNVRINGQLFDDDGNGVAFRQIWYEFGLPSYSCEICDDDDRRVWQALGPVKTDESGSFILSFYAGDKGQYAVRASFAGDDIYGNSESETKYVQVF